MNLALFFFAVITVAIAQEFRENQLQDADHLEALLQEEAQNDINEQFKREFFGFRPRYRINVAHKYPVIHRPSQGHHHHHQVRPRPHPFPHPHPHPHPVAGPKYNLAGYTTKLIPVKIRPLRIKPNYGPPHVVQMNDWRPVPSAPSLMWQMPPKHMILKPFKPSQQLYPAHHAPISTKPSLITMSTQGWAKPTPVTVLKPVAVQPTVPVRPVAFPIQQGVAHPPTVTVLRPTHPAGAVTILQPVHAYPQQIAHVPVQPIYQQQHVIGQVPTFLPQNQLVSLGKPHLPVLPLGATYPSSILKPHQYPAFTFGPPVVQHLPHPELPIQHVPAVSVQPAVPVHPTVPVQPTVAAHPVQPDIPSVAHHPPRPIHPFLQFAPTPLGTNPFLNPHLFSQYPQQPNHPQHPNDINGHIPQDPNEHPAQVPTTAGPQHLPGVPGEHPFQFQPPYNQFPFHQLPQQPDQQGQFPQHTSPFGGQLPQQPDQQGQFPQHTSPFGGQLPQQPSQVPQTQLHGQLTNFPSHLLDGQNAHQFSHYQHQLDLQQQQQQVQYLPPTSQRLFNDQGQHNQEHYSSSEEDADNNVNASVLEHNPHVLQQTDGQKSLSVQIPVHLPHHPNYKPDLSQFGPGATYSLHGNFHQLQNSEGAQQQLVGNEEKLR